jgi:arsenate reductase (thioredoxin)
VTIISRVPFTAVSKNIDKYTRVLVVVVLGLAGCSTKSDGVPSRSDAAVTTPHRIVDPSTTSVAMHPQLTAYLEDLRKNPVELADDRRATLDRLARFVAEQRRQDGAAKFLFICTHNSRRSHMGQLWASVAAAYYGIDRVETYSGGTETTAFNPRAVASLRRAGLTIDAAPSEKDTDNPRYLASFANDQPTLEAFSKVYDDPTNPTSDFAAIMTCSDADQSCPFVKGAALRVSLPYVDPKASDGTAQEAAAYDERSKQIATEMLYLFSRVQAHG